MKTLTRLAVPLAIIALLAIPAAYADHDRYGYRDNHGRHTGYHNDHRDNRDGFYTHDTRRRLAEYERDRRKRAIEAARHYRQHHAVPERGYGRSLRNERYDHRHVVNCRHWSHFKRTGASYNRHRHDQEEFWSVVRDVVFAY